MWFQLGETMNIATTQKTAASSTPPAAPATSQVAVDTQGADTGEVTSADIALALGLTPEGQETDSDDESADDGADDSSADDLATAADEHLDSADDDASTDDTAATDESDDAAAEGDAAAEPGESTTTEESADTATEGEPPAEAKAGRKNEVFQQRINELSAERRSAQEEAAQLREKLSTYQARENGALDATALDTVDTPEELHKVRQRYIGLQKWAMANPDGGKMPDGKGGETEFSREEVAHIHAQAFERLNSDVPRREQYLNHRGAAEQEALRSYPWLSDRTKGDGQMVQKAIEAIPFLRQVPSYRIIAANAYVGEKLRRAGIQVDDALIARLTKEQAAKATGKPAASNGSAQPHRPAAPPPRAPAAPGRAGSLPARRAPAQAQIRAQEKRMVSSSGSVDSIADSIAAKLQPARR